MSRTLGQAIAFQQSAARRIAIKARNAANQRFGRHLHLCAECKRLPVAEVCKEGAELRDTFWLLKDEAAGKGVRGD